MEPKGFANPIVFCLAVIGWSNTSICNLNFWSNGVIPTLRGRKGRKSSEKNVENLPEILKWHENNSVCTCM